MKKWSKTGLGSKKVTWHGFWHTGTDGPEPDMNLKPSPAAPGYHLGRAFSFSVSWVFPLVFTGMKRFSVMIKGGMQGKTEKAMATHSNTLVWKIPWTEEPKRLQSMGSLRVRND